MSEVYGSGKFQYSFVPNWAKLPSGWAFQECPGVAVDSKDNVYVLTRGKHPVIVFDKDGKFLRSFGDGLLSNRTHGIFIAPDDTMLIADDGIHTIQKFTPSGERLMEIGQRDHPAPGLVEEGHRAAYGC